MKINEERIFAKTLEALIYIYLVLILARLLPS